MKSKAESIVGVAVFHNSIVKGYVTLKEDARENETVIQAHLSGLKPNRKYAWHIHEAGDLREARGGKKCQGACAHYNPYGKKHGGPRSKERHVGDLGNLKTDDQGQSRSRIRISNIKLHGKYSVIGRSIVIHEGEDDMGQGGTEESSKTGSAGGRIACGVIGYGKEGKLYF